MGKESRSDRDRRDRDRDRHDSSSRRDKDREREKDRDRRRERDERRRSRSKSRSPKRAKRDEKERDREGKRKHEEKKQTEKVEQPVEEEEWEEKPSTQEEVQAEIERVMQLRREKIEKWRAAKGLLKEKEEPKEEDEEPAEEPSKKKWSLEDDEDEELGGDDDEKMEEEFKPPPTNGAKKEEEDDDDDPLDAFMADVTKEVNKSKKVTGEKGVVRIVSLKKEEPEKQKPEILEADDNLDVVVDDGLDIDMNAATSLLAKGRMLAQTDHDMVYYRPFRKDFYVEVAEISRMSKEEVDEYREELDGIQVRGKCPRPIKTWAQCGTELKVLNIMKRLGYKKPTPIQAQAIPAIMSGRDVIGIAKTGSGKTLAFLLPMFRHIMDQPELDEMDGPIAVIMSPTRELAMQTWKEANKFAKSLGLRVVCVYGGVGISEQIADLKRGAEVIVCTPGRMIDMLAANNGKVTNLRRCTYLVLDEADRMFDMGFEPQVTKIVNNIRPDRQTVLFSATFPRQMEALARKILDRPVEIQVGGRSVVSDMIEQNAVVCEEHQKFLKLLELLGIYYEAGNVIAFCDKQEKADEIVADLMRNGYSCAPLHGGIDQFDRDSTITDFKSGVIKLLVATSVAARGLDVKNLILVVNYDCPNHYEDYVHRVGRTGRAGNKGYAYTFVLPEGQEKMAGEVCKAFELADKEPPEDLKQIWEKFKAEMAAQGKDVKLGGRGFSGTGHKFDDDEAEADLNRRRMARLVHGAENAMDDDDDDEIESQLSSMMRGKRRMIEGQLPGAAAPLTKEVENKLEKAKELAAKIAAVRNLNAVPEKDAVQLTAEAVMRGEAPVHIELSAKQTAQQLAEKLNERLNYAGGEAVAFETSAEDLCYFEEELEINDFPQTVRYRVCSRESLGHIAEYADVGISVRGTHIPEGRHPKEGEQRLFLFLEARSEMNLRRAREEIVRIMKDAFRQLQSQAARAGPQSRYKV